MRKYSLSASVVKIYVSFSSYLILMSLSSKNIKKTKGWSQSCSLYLKKKH